MTPAVLAALAAVAGCATSAPASSAPSAAASAASNAESGTTSTLYDVGCLTASRCFAVGDAGTLLATTDGGRTWSREASPAGAAGAAPLYRIACVAPASCYVIARPGTILVTHDAGAHWAARALPVNVPGLAQAGCVVGDASNPQGEVPCRLGLLDISCPSALTCYAVATGAGGWDTSPLSRGAGPGSSLWLTRDGGATWTSQPLPRGVVCNGDCSSTPYGYPLEWVSCAPSGPCWAGGNQLIGSHEGFAAAWLTTPAPGGSWRLEPGPVSDVGACPTSAGCYAVNNSSPFGDGSSVSRYAATAQNGPSVTVPNGLVINDIACPAARTCYTAGAGGVILLTTNGTTFTPVKTSVRATLNGITCVTASDCYAVGAAGTIEALQAG
jgi:Photosynthesis system II assembly factor YCF48